MSELRPLSLDELDDFVGIVANAYPGMELANPEARDQFRQRTATFMQEDPWRHFYGLYRQGRMQGGMILYDFTMNLLGSHLPVGGVGMVAVDLPFKKEHVARDMIRYFLRYYRERGAPLALLYPFRPDFYKQMGFGYGTKVNQYRLCPAALPRGAKSNLRPMALQDHQALADCYARFAAGHHGMIERPATHFPRLLSRPVNRVVGYEHAGQVQGYMVFNFEKGEKSFIAYDLHVLELLCEHPEALAQLLAFLHTQADQVRRVMIETQDESWHFVTSDPRNGEEQLIPVVNHETNRQGLGLMYRVLDIPGVLGHLQGHNFGGQTLRLQLTVSDTFLPENAGSYLLCFEQGQLHLEEEGAYDVGAEMKVDEFSSLLVGTVDFSSLYGYSLARISDASYVKAVDRAFAVEKKPICMTQF